MVQRTPQFWYNNTGIMAKILPPVLAPLSFLYQLGHKVHQSWQTPKSVNIPVICIGNLTAGGAGKTPTSIALLKLLKEKKHIRLPMFLTRGYGGSLTEPECVDTSGSARIWGDEPLLLAQHTTTIVARNRYEGAKLAQKEHADLIIMDDGLQNNSLKKDISFVVINGQSGFGNFKTIPSGPLREPLSTGIDKADAFIFMGEDKRNTQDLLPNDKPVFNGTITVPENGAPDKNKKYIGFSGIAHPEKFKQTLLNHSFEIVDFIPFSDHHTFSEKDMKKLLTLAKQKNATLITTEKDYVRLSDITIKEQIKTLPIQLSFSKNEKEKIINFIEKKIKIK